MKIKSVIGLLCIMLVFSVESVRWIASVTGLTTAEAFIRCAPFYVAYAVICCLLESIIIEMAPGSKKTALVLLQLCLLPVTIILTFMTVGGQLFTDAVNRISPLNWVAIAAIIAIYTVIKSLPKK